MNEYRYVWFWTLKARPAMGDRKGQRCKVLARSRRMNSVALEFEDGYRVITSRNGIRKIMPPNHERRNELQLEL